MKNIAILGSSGHCKVIIDIIEKEGLFDITGIIDNNRSAGEVFFGYKIIGCDADIQELTLKNNLHGCIIAVGDNTLRSNIAKSVTKIYPDVNFITSKHPSAVIGRDTIIGAGSIIMAGAVIGPNCNIGNFCILNTNSSLDHDSSMGDFSSLGPGAVTGGNCHIGNKTAICINATLIQGITIGSDSVIGGGSLVLESFPKNTLAYGCPAKYIMSRNEGDKYL